LGHLFSCFNLGYSKIAFEKSALIANPSMSILSEACLDMRVAGNWLSV